jgi:hypothetical protein
MFAGIVARAIFRLCHSKARRAEVRYLAARKRLALARSRRDTRAIHSAEWAVREAMTSLLRTGA